ncbi:MAG: chloride channel protein [Euzebyaceae bacterium]|nr:chloride channel protein [Euzebyaceae bacterium]
MCPCCGQAASAPVCEWCRFDSSDDDARAGLQRYRDDAVERRRSSLRGRLTRWWALGPRAFHTEAREQSALLRHLLKWLALGAVVGVLAGASAAVFLYGLGLVTSAREASPWLLAFLPLGGFAVGLAYHYVGGRAGSGNALILDEIHGVAPEGDKPSSDESWVPRRLAPLVLIGTWVTHLFGGSAGREGTAIQMSSSLTDGFSRMVGLRREDRRIMLIAAVSGGFGSVFSVPLAGAVFGLEVQSVGRIRYDALLPALTASIVGNIATQVLHLPHDVTPTVQLADVPLEAGLLGAVALAALAFGLASVLFIELIYAIKRLYARFVPWPPARPLIGGVAVIGLTLMAGTTDYLGLSLPLIGRALTGGELFAGAFLLKLLFTAVTLGSGFQGGEVTPLFVIGATLGAALAALLGVPVELLAAVGFVAVFAAATNTPLACTIMGLELFGTGALPYVALGCVIAYICSSHRGIYETQRVDTPKAPNLVADGDALTLYEHGRRRRNRE